MTELEPRIVSREAWIAERLALLDEEKALTRQMDAVRERRRWMPWVKVVTPYVFQSEDGPRTLQDLFAGRSQLAIYHFMLAPGSSHICDGCAFLADHIDAARQHFENADLSFAAISRAPLAQIARVRRRMGWTFDWLSSNGSEFNYDYGVSFRDDQVAADRPLYNYATSASLEPDLPGASIFAKGRGGDVYHTYSTYARGLELLGGAFNWLDLVPKGRNEAGGIMSWVKLHDEYAAPSGQAACCHHS